MRIQPDGGQNLPHETTSASLVRHSFQPPMTTGGNRALIPHPGMQIQAMVPYQQPVKDQLTPMEALRQWQAHQEEAGTLEVRWLLENMPLGVYIDPPPSGVAPATSSPSGNSEVENGKSSSHGKPEAANLRKLIFTSMRQWEAASGGLIRFNLLDLPATRESADILITWSAETTLGRENEVGHTNRELQGRRITRALITLIENPRIDARLSPHRQGLRLIATVLHETGHALGLEHSQDSRDLMHHRGWQRPSLSANDINRLKALYAKSSLLF